MSLFKRICFINALLILFLLESAHSQSLPETITLSLQNSSTIKAQEQAIRRSALDAKSTFRSTLPRVDIDASYRHVTEVAELNLPSAGPVSAGTVRMGVHDSYESALNANYVLFSGFAQRNQIRIKNQQHELQRRQGTELRRQIAFRTIAAYRQAQNYHLEISALEAGKRRIQLQLQRLRSLVRQEMALPLDTLSLAIARSDYDHKIISARVGLETALQQLQNLSGQTVTVDSFAVTAIGAHLASLSWESMTSLTILEQQRRIMETSQSLARSAYYPRVALQAGIKYGKPGVDFIQNDWMTYGVWGIGLSWNIFSWGADHLQVQAGAAAVKEVDFRIEAEKERIRTEYDTALRQFRSLQEQLAVVQGALRLARTKMNIIESRYRQGMASVTEFSDANLELTQTELNQRRHLIRMAVKVNEIDLISGKPISQWSIER